MHEICDLPTTLSLVRAGAEILAKAGITSARLDAELLLAQAMSVERMWLFLHPKECVSAESEAVYWKLIERRQKHEPLAYIAGEKEFYGYAFWVTNAVLIPRPDTEVVVEKALMLLPKDEAVTVVDVCTGSGCIAATIALERQNAGVFATEISRDAADIARQNIHRHGLEERVNIYEGSLLEAILAMTPRPFVDLIISNPPYIRFSDYLELEPTVRDYEPQIALVGAGEHGLHCHAQIIKAANLLLKPGGYLVLEIGYDQKDALSALPRDGFLSPTFFEDYGRNTRGCIFRKCDG